MDLKEFGDYYERVIKYQYQLAEKGNIHEFFNVIHGVLPKELEEKAMTWAEQLKQEGAILERAGLFEKILKKCGFEKAAADLLDVELAEFLRVLEAKKKLERNTKH